MPNPEGTNSFDRFSPEPQYGEKLHADALQRASPIPTPGSLSAPKKAQRAAVKGGQQEQSAPPPQPQVAPEMTAKQAWSAVGEIPELSPLAKSLIARLT